MSEKKGNVSRRDFLKAAGAVSLGSSFVPSSASAKAFASASTGYSEKLIVPTRPFGKTGVDVSILSLGGVLELSDQLMFRQAIKMGVSYWDTADSYGWGKSEKAIGKYFSRFPDDRKKVFLVTKSSASDPKKLSANFYASIGSETDDALKLTERLLAKGYTAEQANLKVVWENPNIASICSAMPNMTILQANVAAALNKEKLTSGDKKRLEN